MKKRNSPMARALVSGCLLASSGIAAAAYQNLSFSWDYVHDGNPAAWTAGSEGKMKIGGVDTTLVSISNATAWANTEGAAADDQPFTNYQQQGFGTSSTGSLRVATIVGHGTSAGGSEPTGSPDHAIDNQGAHEFVLFEFSDAVTLNSLKISFPGGSTPGTDVSILAYKGAGAPNMALIDSDTAGGLYDPITNPGGTVEPGDLGDTNTWERTAFNANESDENTGLGLGVTGFSMTTESKYWLVGAYNKHLGGIANTTVDAIKLAGLGGNFKFCPPGNPGPGCTPGGGGGGNVPEPSTLTLAALGMLGGIRRWKKRA